jgi:hypothetical protein
MTSKRWFELECPRCRGCFVEMVDLLFHPCPNRPDAQNRPRRGAKRLAKGRVAARTERLLPAAEGRR